MPPPTHPAPAGANLATRMAKAAAPRANALARFTLPSILVAANQEVGNSSMRWRAASAGMETGGHMERARILGRRPDDFEISMQKRMNCWEAVVYLGYRSIADPVTRRGLRLAIAETVGDESEYRALMVEGVLDFPGAHPATVGQLAPADVVFLYGESHVALHHLGGAVFSLWFGPNDISKLQRTDVHALLNLIEATPSVHLHALTTMVQSMSPAVQAASQAQLRAAQEALRRGTGARTGSTQLAVSLSPQTLSHSLQRVPNPFSPSGYPRLRTVCRPWLERACKSTLLRDAASAALEAMDQSPPAPQTGATLEGSAPARSSANARVAGVTGDGSTRAHSAPAGRR